MTVLRVLDLLGVAVFAASGALAAGRRSLDLLGVLVIAAVTAIGGGTIRDVLLGGGRVFWLDDPVYLYVIVATALVTMGWTRVRRAPDNALAVADALGLGFFAIGGAQVAEGAGYTGIVVVLMGTITGSAGGVVRDVLTNDVPMILRRGELYATAAIVGTSLYLVLQGVGMPMALAGACGTFTVVAIRLGAVLWGWKLPTFTVQE